MTEHDRFWRGVIDRYHADVEAMQFDPASLRAAERALDEVEPEPLPAATIDRIVEEATGTAPRGTVVAGRFRWRRWLSAAALVVGVMGVAAVGWLDPWPERRMSHDTLDYPGVLVLAVDPGTDIETRKVALSRAFNYVDGGVRVLQGIVEQGSPGASVARGTLARLRAVVGGEMWPRPLPPAEEINPWIVALHGGQLSEPEAAVMVRNVAVQISVGIWALQQAADGMQIVRARAQDDAADYLERIAARLSR